MRAVLVPFGSHGDVHPFIGLGHALRRRGHDVVFVVAEYFGPLVRGLGFACEGLGTPEEFRERLNNPDLWHPRKGLSVVARSVVDHVGLSIERIESQIVPGETVLVGGTMAFVTRLVQERSAVPTASVHLQPACLHSDIEPPVYPALDVPRWWPVWFRRIFFRAIFALGADPMVRAGLNDRRRELGLPPLREVMMRWLHSPELVIGLFPEWFGPPQADWPPNVRLTDFPLYDEADAAPLDSALESFLAEGPPPIVFTAGSANVHALGFFQAAAEACRRMERRGLLLTRFADQVPRTLPAGVAHVEYAPFSRLLPRSAALVHHGGIGTCAQGMAAGVPQLVTPLSHDQFDNAARMTRLGVAQSVRSKSLNAATLEGALGRLLDAPGRAAACRAVADRFAKSDRAMDGAVDALEALAARSAPGAGQSMSAPA